MTGLISKLLILLLFALPANAFVEKLNPANPAEGGIPCMGIGAMLFFFISPGGPSGAILNSIIQREWVPSGWSERDLTDNTNLVTILNAAPTIDEKENIVHKVLNFCVLWEMGVDEVNTPAKFRTRLGLPAQLP